MSERVRNRGSRRIGCQIVRLRCTLCALSPIYFGIVLLLGGVMFLWPSWQFTMDVFHGFRAQEPPAHWFTLVVGTMLWVWGLLMAGVGIYDAIQMWRSGGRPRT